MEQIKKIKDVEGQADKIRRDGQAEAKKLVNDAAENAAALIAKAQSEAESKSKEILDKANAAAQAAYDEIIAKAVADCKAIQADAEQKLDKAVSVIVGKVVN